MTSSAIATKHRPTSFKDVIGQGPVVKSLKNAIAGKLGTAFLFIGPSGTGKTTLARIAAAELGCDPADLQEEDAATKTGIENIREIIDSLRYRPMGEGAIKAVIIDEVHQLSKSAMTALLKSLEDPPSWVYWFLCTTEASKIPVAVKTRCLTYQLKEVRFDDLMDLLEGLPEAKKIADKILELCAREAGGSPRQALSNLGVCLEAEDELEAADLLRTAESSVEAFELARALMKGVDWRALCVLLAKLKEAEANPESVRHVVRAYMTKVVLGSKSDRDTETALAVLREFSQPFNSSDGLSPLVLACGNLVFNN